MGACVNGSANGYYAPELADALHAEAQEPLRHLVLESIRVGLGGDTLLGDFLGLDVHTVARGRQQLLDRNVRGLEPSPDQIASLRLQRHETLPEWNYTIRPQL